MTQSVLERAQAASQHGKSLSTIKTLLAVQHNTLKMQL